MSVSTPVIDHLDLATKHIYLLAGCREYHPVEDIYCEIRNLRRTDESKRVFDIPVTAAGAVPKGGGKFTPRYAIFNYGWKVVPENVDHSLYITGEQITDDGQSGPACIDTAVLTSSVIIQYEPPAAEIIRDEQSLAAIEAMSFNRCVTIDVNHGLGGTAYPAGNTEYFSNNMADGLQIAINRRLHKFCVQQDLELGAESQVPAYKFEGLDALNTSINVLDAADVTGCQFDMVTLSGSMDGLALVQNSRLVGVSSINGIAHNCQLEPGTITLAPGVFHLLDSNSGLPGLDAPHIDFNGSGASFGARSFDGGLILENKDGPEAVSIDLAAGQVKIDMATVTNGTIVIRGDGKCIDLATGEHIWTGVYGDLIIVNETNSPDSMSRAVWSTEIETGYMAAEILRLMSSVLAGQLSGAAGDTLTFRDINDVVDRVVATRDSLGNRSNVALDLT